MLKVIFACVHNAGRSQIAAAFFNQLAHPQKSAGGISGHRARRARPSRSAGRYAGGGNRPEQRKPQRLTEELAKDAQLLITMGCGDKCPYVPGLRRDDWALQDPKGLPIEEVRTIPDEIKRRVQNLLSAEQLQPT